MTPATFAKQTQFKANPESEDRKRMTEDREKSCDPFGKLRAGSEGAVKIPEVRK